MPDEASDLLASSPELFSAFTYSQARAAGLSKRGVYRLRDQGLIEPLGRGLYRLAAAPLADLGLIAIATRAPRATLCLATALVQHGLSDAIPAAPDIALPRGSRAPSTRSIAQWHHFDAQTFDLGRGEFALDETTSIGLYSAERSIIDAYRTRRTEGHELANEALRRWLRKRGSQPAQLLSLATNWPRTVAPLRVAMEVLL
jgi:predicted transcriptional regulator of viral defense system